MQSAADDVTRVAMESRVACALRHALSCGTVETLGAVGARFVTELRAGGGAEPAFATVLAANHTLVLSTRRHAALCRSYVVARRVLKPLDHRNVCTCREIVGVRGDSGGGGEACTVSAERDDCAFAVHVVSDHAPLPAGDCGDALNSDEAWVAARAKARARARRAADERAGLPPGRVTHMEPCAAARLLLHCIGDSEWHAAVRDGDDVPLQLRRALVAGGAFTCTHLARTVLRHAAVETRVRQRFTLEAPFLVEAEAPADDASEATERTCSVAVAQTDESATQRLVLVGGETHDPGAESLRRSVEDYLYLSYHTRLMARVARRHSRACARTPPPFVATERAHYEFFRALLHDQHNAGVDADRTAKLEQLVLEHRPLVRLVRATAVRLRAARVSQRVADAAGRARSGSESSSVLARCREASARVAAYVATAVRRRRRQQRVWRTAPVDVMPLDQFLAVLRSAARYSAAGAAVAYSRRCFEASGARCYAVGLPPWVDVLTATVTLAALRDIEPSLADHRPLLLAHGARCYMVAELGLLQALRTVGVTQLVPTRHVPVSVQRLATRGRRDVATEPEMLHSPLLLQMIVQHRAHLATDLPLSAIATRAVILSVGIMIDDAFRAALASSVLQCADALFDTYRLFARLVALWPDERDLSEMLQRACSALGSHEPSVPPPPPQDVGNGARVPKRLRKTCVRESNVVCGSLEDAGVIARLSMLTMLTGFICLRRPHYIRAGALALLRKQLAARGAHATELQRSYPMLAQFVQAQTDVRDCSVARKGVHSVPPAADPLLTYRIRAFRRLSRGSDATRNSASQRWVVDLGDEAADREGETVAQLYIACTHGLIAGDVAREILMGTYTDVGVCRRRTAPLPPPPPTAAHAAARTLWVDVHGLEHYDTELVTPFPQDANPAYADAHYFSELRTRPLAEFVHGRTRLHPVATFLRHLEWLTCAKPCGAAPLAAVPLGPGGPCRFSAARAFMGMPGPEAYRQLSVQRGRVELPPPPQLMLAVGNRDCRFEMSLTFAAWAAAPQASDSSGDNGSEAAAVDRELRRLAVVALEFQSECTERPAEAVCDVPSTFAAALDAVERQCDARAASAAAAAALAEERRVWRACIPETRHLRTDYASDEDACEEVFTAIGLECLAERLGISTTSSGFDATHTPASIGCA